MWFYYSMCCFGVINDDHDDDSKYGKDLLQTFENFQNGISGDEFVYTTY